MKVGVSSYSFSKYLQQTGCNYLKLCDLAKEMGFDGIEFTDLLPEVSGKPALEAAAEIREKLRRLSVHERSDAVAEALRRAEENARE